MRLVAIFIALIATVPAFAAPVPHPTSIDDLVSSAHGDPMALIKKLRPITDEIAALVLSMESHASISPSPSPKSYRADPGSSHAAQAKSPAGPPPVQPEMDEADTEEAEPDGPTAGASDTSGAASPLPADEPSPSPAPAKRSVKEEQKTHVAAGAGAGTPPSMGSHSHHSHAHKPHADKAHDVRVKDVRKLRDLMNEAKTIERAIETVFLNSGQNIDDLPSPKSAEGVAWGIANGPILAMAKMFRFSDKGDIFA